MEYQDFDGVQRSVTAESKSKTKGTLVNLWASWCQPCLEELKELAQHRTEIDGSGLEVIALSVDGVGMETDSSEKVLGLALLISTWVNLEVLTGSNTHLQRLYAI